MASLLLAFVLALPLLGLFAYKQNAFGMANLGLGIFYPLGAITLLVFLTFSKRILIFSRKCPDCGSLLNWKQTLYVDHPLCKSCEIKGYGEISKTVPDSVDEIDWKNWTPKEEAVICYIIDEENQKVLLMHKKTGLGKGKVNAPGGRIEKGETSLDAAVRECQEEVHMTPNNLEKRMELFFQFKDGYSLRGDAYFSSSWDGEPVETREADPFWCPLAEIPYDKMWADDLCWLPKALKGEKLIGHYIFDGDEMISEKTEPVKNYKD